MLNENQERKSGKLLMDNEQLDKNKKLLAAVFREIEEMGHVVVGKHSYVESIS